MSGSNRHEQSRVIRLQEEICAFVREIVSARTGEAVQLVGNPERNNRTEPVVEELWDSPSLRYAVEHTRIEAFEGQIQNNAQIERLLVPVVRERAYAPDMIVLVETDASPWSAWVLKDGDRMGDEVPRPNGVRCYERNHVCGLPFAP